MAIAIIEKGTLPAPTPPTPVPSSYKLRCWNCKILFVFERADITHLSGDYLKAPHGYRVPVTVAHISCPLCGIDLQLEIANG